ncbi:trehalase family glycosidase [Streptomyces sp. NPDC056503]|uniref:MGH1-like glycoside hydrolase domain-containing protein n=1 Tax=Streptomyces sp. NPDC056503 TaxID=3345842 RepID=UPI00368ECB22
MSVCMAVVLGVGAYLVPVLASPPTAAAAEPTGSLAPVTDGFGSSLGSNWRTVGGSWRTRSGVLRGSGELRRPLCACGPDEELREARVSLRFKVPASSTDSWASVAVALNGAGDDESLWVTALPYQSGPRIQIMRRTSSGETTYAETLRDTTLTPGSWYRLELEWRHGIAFARVWADGSARPATPMAGHVLDAVDFHPVSGGIRTYGLPSVDADDFSATWLTKGDLRSVTDKGGFAPLSQNLVAPPTYSADRLPKPVIDGNPEWKTLYDEAWSILHDSHLRRPVSTSPFVRTYMDEAFDTDIVFQWDTIFMTLYGRYMGGDFDAMGSLDNWYAMQEPTGAIWRIYVESSGARHPWADGASAVNPPLFAWAELKSYQMTGDLARVRRVLPALQAYADWVSVGRWSQEAPHQLYWNNGVGNGMDNLPTQPGHGGDGYGTGQVDMSSQMVLMWDSLAQLHAATGDTARAEDSGALADATADRVNRFSWNETDGRYYELTSANEQWKIDSIAGFWTLVSGVAPSDRAQRLAGALTDTRKYWTDMVFPALAKDEPAYRTHGEYWRGGAWAPTNYATIKGLKTSGNAALARAAAEKYLAGLAEVYDYTGTLWETYAPERQPGSWITGSRSEGGPVVAPGKSLDASATYLSPATTSWGDGANSTGGTDNISKSDFVGWTGLGPIALLIEDVIGIEVDAPHRTIDWRLTRTDRNGVQDLSLGSLGTVSLVADARSGEASPVRVCATSTASEPLTLNIKDSAGQTRTVTIAAHASGQCQTV